MTERDNHGINSVDGPTLDQDTHWQQVVQRLYDPERDDELTASIVFAIADAKGVSPGEVTSPPLCGIIDVEEIERLFFGFGSDGGPRNGTGCVEFRYAEFLIRVKSDGWVQIYEPAEYE